MSTPRAPRLRNYITISETDTLSAFRPPFDQLNLYKIAWIGMLYLVKSGLFASRSTIVLGADTRLYTRDLYF